MNKTLPDQVVFCSLVHVAGVLIGQLLLGVDGVDPVTKSLHIVVVLPMFFHECIDFAAACCTGGENQNVALRLTFFWGLSFVKGLNHEYIVNRSPMAPQ